MKDKIGFLDEKDNRAEVKGNLEKEEFDIAFNKAVDAILSLSPEAREELFELYHEYWNGTKVDSQNEEFKKKIEIIDFKEKMRKF